MQLCRSSKRTQQRPNRRKQGLQVLACRLPLCGSMLLITAAHLVVILQLSRHACLDRYAKGSLNHGKPVRCLVAACLAVRCGSSQQRVMSCDTPSRAASSMAGSPRGPRDSTDCVAREPVVVSARGIALSISSGGAFKHPAARENPLRGMHEQVDSADCPAISAYH